MTQIGVGESDAGEKGPQRHGEPEVMGDQGRSQAREEARQEQHLADTGSRQMAQQDGNQVAARQKDAGHHDQTFDQTAEHRQWRKAVSAGQNRNDQQHGYDEDVLEEEDPQRQAAVGCLDLPPVGVDLEHDGGTAQGEHETAEQGQRPGGAEQERDGDAERRGQCRLEGTAEYEQPAQTTKLGRRQLEADHEEHQCHRQLGEGLHVAGVRDQLETIGADQDTREQETDDSRVAQSVAECHDGQRRPENDDNLEKDGRVRHVRQPLMRCVSGPDNRGR